MKNADTTLPRLTTQIDSVCTSGGRRLRPNSHSPMNVDSRKNASRPSMASGAPKMLPTNTE
jgi:hypothetical protein